MRMTSRPLLALLLVATLAPLSLVGCKRKETAPVAPPADVAANAAPAASAPVAPAVSPAGARAFDITSVPLSDAAIPPFPYLELPPNTNGYHKAGLDFDRAWVVAGDELRTVEGRTSERWFPIDVANMSKLSAFRNYETAIKSMGGVRVDTIQPLDPAFIARNGGDKEALLKKLHLPNGQLAAADDTPGFSQYLVRTPKENIWIAVMFFDGDLNLSIRVIREQAMEQTIGLIKADAMHAALAKDGHIALYINFDNDSDTIRADSKPAIDEIAKMMAADPSLKVRVEGHTDNNGTEAHNISLSRARSEAVAKAIAAHQIAKDRLTSEGVGAAKPLVGNDSEEGRAKNRRVELVKI